VVSKNTFNLATFTQHIPTYYEKGKVYRIN